MSWGYFLKVNILILAFVLVLLSIHKIKIGGITSSLEALLGIEPQVEVELDEDSPLRELAQGVTRFFWCQTRVQKLEFASGESLEQEGLRWFWTSAEGRQELNSVLIEKWFGDHCTLEIKQLAADPVLREDMGLWMRVHFIRGNPQDFHLNPSLEVFHFSGRYFMSPQLVEATLSLKGLTP